MSLKVIVNGLWSEESRKATILYGTRGFDPIQSSIAQEVHAYESLTQVDLEAAIEEAFSTPDSRGRDIVMHTGTEGHRQFQEAVMRAVDENLVREIQEYGTREGSDLPIEWEVTTSRPEEYGQILTVNSEEMDITYVDPMTPTPTLEPMIGFSQTTYIPNNTYLEMQTALLRNGSIDNMTFLDRISEHDEQLPSNT